MKVIARQYSRYFDLSTGVQFDEVLDRVTGTYIGFADVTEEQAAIFEAREHFEVVAEDVFKARTEHAAQPQPAAPATGDPIGDLAKSQGNPADTLNLLGQGAPPHPPPSK